jgi:hypothetical protein
MKNIFLVLITFLTFNLFGQPPGGGGGRGQQGQRQQSEQAQEVKRFSARDAAGLFYYDVEKVIKKIKVKDEKKQYQVKKALRNYNFKVKEILFLNSEKLSDLDSVMSSLPKPSKKERNQSSKDNSEENTDRRKIIGNIIGPIRDEVHMHEAELNEMLEGTLSEKQQKKWLKYQKSKKESLVPKKPQNRGNQNSRQSGGQRQRRQ